MLLLLDNREFNPYWLETGSPTFLFETLKARSVGLQEIEGRRTERSLVARFDVDDIGVEALLFQTGYLTIVDEQREGHRTSYRLDYPNREVRLSLNDELLAHLDARNRVPLEEARTLHNTLEANDFAGFAATLRFWLARIPYQWHATGDLVRYEAWYASLLHMTLRAIGVDVRSEAATSHSRADMVVSLGEQVFIFEFKMADSADDVKTALAAAFTQMRARGYAETYRDREEPVHRVAIACGREVRNLLEVRAGRHPLIG